MRRFWVIATILIILSCGKDDSVVSTVVDATITAWLDSLNIVATRDNSGIYYYPMIKNTTGATVTAGSVAGIYYTLSDLDGLAIASHQRSNGDSLILKQGVSAVFPVGLDIGLAFMRVGETYRFILPPSLAYGSLSSGAIRSGLIALLEVEVTSITDETSVFAQELIDIAHYIQSEDLNDTIANPVDRVKLFASGVAYKRIVIGSGSLPLNGNSIVVNYDGFFLDNSNFESKTGFQFVFGSDAPRPLVAGFEFGISLTQINERSLIIVPSSQAYRESTRVIPSFITDNLTDDSIVPDYVSVIPPYSTLIFEVTRVD